MRALGERDLACVRGGRSTDGLKMPDGSPAPITPAPEPPPRDAGPSLPPILVPPVGP
jgi:hypothetical protein